jgi:arabinose-5-phosphate isomerase
LNSLLASLRKRCAAVIAMTGRADSTLGTAADVVLDISVPREACSLGLAPTASTTATIALGDALAVVLMNRNQFQAEDFRHNHPAGSLGERLKVRVAEVMLTGKRIPQVRPEAMLDQAVDELNEKNLGAVLVVAETGRVAGIITDGDVRRFVAGRQKSAELPVTKIMTADPLSISDDKQAVDALSIMQQHEITVLPVVGSGAELLGILHLHDLLGKGEFRFLL